MPLSSILAVSRSAAATRSCLGKRRQAMLLPVRNHFVACPAEKEPTMFENIVTVVLLGAGSYLIPAWVTYNLSEYGN